MEKEHFALKYYVPNFWSRLLWKYGYVNAFDKPIARKNRITGRVYIRRWNESFTYWGWNEIEKVYKNNFIQNKQNEKTN